VKQADERQPTTRLSIVMPAYDELPNLRELLPRVSASVATLAGVSAEITVVLPAQASEADVAELTTLGARPVRRGPTDSFGDAIRSGIAAADPASDYLLIMDADGSHDPATIPRLLAAVDGAHVVVASRYVAGGTTDNSFILHAMSRALNLAYRVILGIACNDVSTNFKLYRRADLAKITLTTKDFDVVEEILFRLKVLHGKSLVITEVPDRFFERNHGVTKRKLGPFVVSYLKTLLYLSWLGRRGGAHASRKYRQEGADTAVSDGAGTW
jgi:dolichol-phosphate mannosyltransferase